MLDKLIIHLKNIIFFKAVIYLIVIIALIALIPVVSKDMKKSVAKNKKSYTLLQKSGSKLNSIVNFEDKILNTEKNYDSLVKKVKNQPCLDRTNLINKISTLNEKYSFFEPIFVRISRQFNDEIANVSTQNAKINQYEIRIIFKTKDHRTMLMVCNEIYHMLPNGSIVTDTTIKKNEGLTPTIISKLNAQNSPGLLEVKMNIQLREVIYEK